VSHDLPLLDTAITSVLDLDHARLEAYRGNYSSFVVERKKRRQQRERERRHQDEAIERLEANIRRFKGTTEKMAKTARAWETRVERMKVSWSRSRRVARRWRCGFRSQIPRE
jgi:ATP-binding cassette subfamily F protein 3